MVRNAVLIGVALAAALPANGRALVWLDAATIAGGAAALAALYAARRRDARERRCARARCGPAHERRAARLPRPALGPGRGARRAWSPRSRGRSACFTSVCRPRARCVGREGPRPGEAAPVVEVEDWSGGRLRLGAPDPEGASTLLLFVAPGCPVCKVVLPDRALAARAEGGRLRLVVASDGTRAEHEAFVREQRLERETLRALGGARARLAGASPALCGADRRAGDRAGARSRQHARASREPARGARAGRGLDPGVPGASARRARPSGGGT